MSKLISNSADGQRCELNDPIAMKKSSAFLWNKSMMIQVNCRGYAVSQFMQPEPAKYTRGPALEAQTFMQPEQPYYAHHPGRFFYIKDEESGEIFSLPYEPVRSNFDSFTFSVGKSDIKWLVSYLGYDFEITLSLDKERIVELWQLKVHNRSAQARKLSVYSYFPVGYMSWMNQSARYSADLQGVVCSSITPYQKVEQYFKNKELKDLTYFLADREPDSWETRQEVFEGEGGLQNPSALAAETLDNGDSLYEMPCCVMQFSQALEANAEEHFRFAFGPAKDDEEIADIRQTFFASDDTFAQTHEKYSEYVAECDGLLEVETPDAALDSYVNHWLARQVFYHGDVNRLSTDPQTRNFLQDNMGMCYVKPERARSAFLHALSQQHETGAMPDGILLMEGAELKYINQVPHTDHCVWLPICITSYLDETNDFALLDENLPYAEEGSKSESVFEHLNKAMLWLWQDRDERGLSYIAQGDWCDPMNMVGYKGRGVSGWLSVATAYAFNTWADICQAYGADKTAGEFREKAQELNETVNRLLWDGRWFARGITDDNVVFGVQKDPEGRIFLNPQSWAMLAGAADSEQVKLMLEAIDEQLATPYGVQMLAPAFTKMRDDVGRVTQKFPGSAENGSIYNHAAAFYIYALYGEGDADRAYKHLRQMVPGNNDADFRQREQLPVFIPNYYRGAYHQHPRTAGRSSQLFNTGTVHWFYRCLIDGLFGLKGCPEGLRVAPQIPQDWPHAKVKRMFRGAQIEMGIRREADCQSAQLSLNGELLDDGIIRNVSAGEVYRLELVLPLAE